MENKEKKLTTRQWKLYNYLKDRGDEWTPQWKIALDLPEYEYDGNEHYASFHDSKARHKITNDIRALNKSSVIQKIILSGSNGVKISNEQEFDKYMAKRFLQAIRRLEYLKNLSRKGGRDGQMRITLGKHERDTIEAFIKGE